MKFSNPIPGSKVKTSAFSKTVELSSFPNDSVLSPYDGIVVDYNPSTCGGYMKIKHVINNEVYFSEFCNLVSSGALFSGSKVREGQTIGQIGTNNIEFTIIDSNGTKQNVVDFLSGVSKKDSEKNKKYDEYKSYDSGNKKVDSVSNTLLKGMLFPFGMLGSVLKKRDEKKKDEQLSEEIQRIKKLLK